MLTHRCSALRPPAGEKEPNPRGAEAESLGSRIQSRVGSHPCSHLPRAKTSSGGSPLLEALRVLRDDRSFHPASESLPEYLNAARAIADTGFRYALFGHTHLKRNVTLTGGARYLNSGCWTDQIRFPDALFVGTDAQALQELRAFVVDLASGRVEGWVRAQATYVRLDVDEHGQPPCSTTRPDKRPMT